MNDLQPNGPTCCLVVDICPVQENHPDLLYPGLPSSSHTSELIFITPDVRHTLEWFSSSVSLGQMLCSGPMQWVLLPKSKIRNYVNYLFSILRNILKTVVTSFIQLNQRSKSREGMFALKPTCNKSRAVSLLGIDDCKQNVELRNPLHNTSLLSEKPVSQI